jgi:hypothetical protein
LFDKEPWFDEVEDAFYEQIFVAHFALCYDNNGPALPWPLKAICCMAK